MSQERVNQRLVELAGGVLVEEDVLRIVEKIKEFDPRLRVKYNPNPTPGSLHEAPYRITEFCPDGFERVVFDVWELDDRVLERLHKADTFKWDIQAQLDADNARARHNQQQRFQEERRELQNLVASIVRSPKDTYVYKDPKTDKKLKFIAGQGVEVDGRPS